MSHDRHPAESTFELATIHRPAFQRLLRGGYTLRYDVENPSALAARPEGFTRHEHLYVPWAVSYNDDPRNGMMLCRLCHGGGVAYGPTLAARLGRCYNSCAEWNYGQVRSNRSNVHPPRPA